MCKGSLTRKSFAIDEEWLVHITNFDLRQADLNSKDSLRGAFKGAYAVFAVTNYWEKQDPKLEVQQGKNIADAAKVTSLNKHRIRLCAWLTFLEEDNVQHLIWSSLLNVTERENLCHLAQKRAKFWRYQQSPKENSAMSTISTQRLTWRSIFARWEFRPPFSCPDGICKTLRTATCIPTRHHQSMNSFSRARILLTHPSRSSTQPTTPESLWKASCWIAKRHSASVSMPPRTTTPVNRSCESSPKRNLKRAAVQGMKRCHRQHTRTFWWRWPGWTKSVPQSWRKINNSWPSLDIMEAQTWARATRYVGFNPDLFLSYQIRFFWFFKDLKTFFFECNSIAILD